MDIERYQRQIALDEIGEAGQEKLLKSRVLVIGAGGLGSPCLLYLAAAGVGTLGVIDDDVVDRSNLQRQVLYKTDEVGQSKTARAAGALNALNPDVEIVKVAVRFNAQNALDVLSGWDFVIDATDNFGSKFLISDFCVEYGLPFSHAGIDQFRGQCLTVIPRKTACYRCVFDEPPVVDSAMAPQGPLGAVPGVIGGIQSAEAVKYLLGIGSLLTNRVLTFDALTMLFRTVRVRPRLRCKACGNK